MTDAEILAGLRDRKIKFHALEPMLAPDFARAVRLRRAFIEQYVASPQPGQPESSAKGTDAGVLADLPHEGFDFSQTYNSNCENPIGYVQVPVGMAGPLIVDGVAYPIPLATTEGALVASTHRGARALSECGGVTTVLLDDGMTRCPVVCFPSLLEAAAFRDWVEKDHFDEVAEAFNSTSRFARLQNIRVTLTGRNAYVRFKCSTGDAMGMNQVTKGVTKALNMLQKKFPQMQVISVSANVCVDKKPSAMNWIEGRGRGVVGEAVVRKDVLRDMLKTDAASLAKLNVDKNLVGSCLAGSVGGFNAHSANVVAAMFIALGQDPAQVVESATCLTLMEERDGDLCLSVRMPSIEVGTVGGGTRLPAQQALLKMVGVAGGHPTDSGKNAQRLARLVCASVMAGELSLMAGLAAGHLSRAHERLGRGQST